MKKLTLLFALLCASVMGWSTQYCGETITATDGATTVNLTCTNPSENTYVVVITSSNENFQGLIGAGNYCYVNSEGNSLQILQTSNFVDFNSSTRTLTITLTSTNGYKPKFYNPFYLNFGGVQKEFTTIQNQTFDWPESCSGGGGEDPGSTPVASPYCETEIKHQNLDNAAENSHVLLSVGSDGKGHTIVDFKPTLSNAVKFDYINIVGKKDVGYDMDNAADGLDEMSMVFHTPDADGDGNITFLVQWSYSGWGGRYEYNVTVPANAVCEHAVPFPGDDHLYCKYTDGNLRTKNANAAVTWSTNTDGDVVIELFDGEGAANTHFRNEGFEYGGKSMDACWMVYSGTNHQTSEYASTYFTVEQATNGGNIYALRKKDGVTLPSGAIIAFVGHAFSWKNDQDGGAYTTKEQFGYTYGAACPHLDAPTNVAIDGTKHITFDAVANAQTYTANVYLNGILKHRQVVSSGDELTFQPYTTGTYQVQVVADASGYPTSDPSEAYAWALTAPSIVVGNSEYCEWALPHDHEQDANLSVETDNDGVITITLSPLSGQTAVFREQGMKLSDFTVGAVHAAASAYFDRTYTAGGTTVVLTPKNASIKPGLGEKIYFNGYVECKVENVDTWPNTSLEYTYGAKCSGQKHVTVAVNDNNMGSATVNSAADVYVDENSQVTCVATPADGYDFVNWTIGGAEVSISATYTPTISVNTDLVANFEVHRITYCRTAITADNGATVYMTAKATGNVQDVTNYPQYRLEFEGMEGYAITGAGNFDVNISHVNGNSGNTGFGNGAWTFVDDPTHYPYGMGYIEFYAENWRQITFPNHYFFFAPGGVVTLNNNFPTHINWSNTCTDENAPVMAAPTATAIDATTIRLTLSATDDYSNTIRYHVVCATAGIDENLDGASGVTVAKDYTGLTSGTTYEFTITAADGTTGSAHVSAAQVCSATPVGDLEAPEITNFTATPSYGYVDLAITATDDMGNNLTYTITYGTENTEVEGAPGVEVTKRIYATPGTDYTFSVVATDAASHTSDAAAVQTTTLTIPAAPAPTHDAKFVYSIYSDAYTPVVAQNFWRSNYGGPAPLAENDYLIYRMTNNTVVWGNADQNGSIHPEDAFYTDGEHFGLDVSNMAYLHFDVWCDAGDQLNTLNLNDNGVAISTTRTVAGEWVSFDVPLAGYNLADKQNLRFFKFHPFNATNCLVAIDNVYFYAVPEDVSFSENENNVALIAEKHKHFVNATISRSFTAGNLYTLVLPFDVDATQTAAILPGQLTKLNNSYIKDNGDMRVNFVDVDAIEAGVPYLYAPSADVTNPVFAGVTVEKDLNPTEPADGLAKYYGIYAPMDGVAIHAITHGYVLGSDQYLYSVADLPESQTMKALRGYFVLNFPGAASAPKHIAKVVFNSTETENATALEELQIDPSQCTKIMLNGLLYIVREGKIYNLQGQLVK